MELKEGAETIINQCLKVSEDEKVLVLNDSNDEELIESLLDVLVDQGVEHELIEYEEPESAGSEPPLPVAEEMKRADVVIAPTMKSLSHTEARKEANKNGTRVATLPEVNKQIWTTSLLADYEEVETITEKVFNLLKDSEKVRVETPSGTNLTFDVEIDTYDKDTGILESDGSFGNLPAGEPNGYPANISGTLVIDHFQFSPKTKKVEIENGEVVSIEDEEGETSELSKAFEKHPCTKKLLNSDLGQILKRH